MLKFQKLITSILTTLLSIYPLFTTFTIEGEVYANKGLCASIFSQLTFWTLVLIIISIYFVEKFNIYIVTVIGILNIILVLVLVINFLNINLLHPANPRQVYIYLITNIGISILYLCCKIVYSPKSNSNNVIGYIPIVLAVILGIIEITIL